TTPTTFHLDLHSWLQSQHGQASGLRGLAGSSLLNPAPLARQSGPYDGPARSSGHPFAELSHGGQAGLGLGVAAPEPGQTSPALALRVPRPPWPTTSPPPPPASTTRKPSMTATPATSPTSPCTPKATTPTATSSSTRPATLTPSGANGATTTATTGP